MASRSVRRGRRSTSKIARKQEESASARLGGGRRQPGSGNQWHSKGDVVLDFGALLECKWTDAARVSVSRKVVNKLRKEMIQESKSYWVVEVWLRTYDAYFYMVCLDLVAEYATRGEIHSMQTSTFDVSERKSLTISASLGSAEYLCLGWEEPFYLLPATRMEKIVESLQHNITVDVGALFHQYLVDINMKPQEQRAVGVFGPSSLGYCLRKAVYRLLGLPPKQRIPPALRNIFLIGHAIHDLKQGHLKEILGECFVAEKRAIDDEYYISGSCDGEFLDGDLPEGDFTEEMLKLRDMFMAPIREGLKAGLELKSISSLPKKPQEKHILQAVAYGWILGLDIMFIHYVVKGGRNGGAEVTFRQPVTESIWLSKIVEPYLKPAKEYTDAGQLPPREISSECDTCPYYHLCRG